jgi:hypothetical protein
MPEEPSSIGICIESGTKKRSLLYTSSVKGKTVPR